LPFVGIKVGKVKRISQGVILAEPLSAALDECFGLLTGQSLPVFIVRGVYATRRGSW
jgi:hypothetical protein